MLTKSFFTTLLLFYIDIIVILRDIIMLCIIQKRIIQKSYCLTRQFTSKIICCQLNQPEKHILQSDTNFTSIQRDPTFLKIAIIGAPNAGKSTLINNLINRSICPTSSKVHTTQVKCDAVYSSENTQLVFIDTPGLITQKEQKKYKLSSSYEKDPKISTHVADIVGVVHDVSNRYTRNKLHNNILDLLKALKSDIPTLLIMNKIDQVKHKDRLLEIIKVLTNKTNWPHFSDVFLISALTSDGIDSLREYLISSAKPKAWQYNEDTYTDQSLETIIQQTVRAKLMDVLPQEIPYISRSVLEYLKIYSEGGICASIIIELPNKKKSSIVIGQRAKRIKFIVQECEKELQYALRAPVKLKILVKSKK
ncbi:GTPase Era, mitochondrial [Vespa velutina]|uniref:GTPase Era, mitochondrial n=1 Tax=Vespa velutina TaxID=202808 RepID=UPI001FB3EBA9|nr:GTPase Era, mitochondrial [Vespa velutina]